MNDLTRYRLRRELDDWRRFGVAVVITVIYDAAHALERLADRLVTRAGGRP